jgi:hypothetical protein
MNALVHGVIWPAVAGSILWTFLQVAFDPRSSGTSLWPRLSALLFVGMYLAIDWVYTDPVASKINKHSPWADLPLAASLSTFAVATQFDRSWAALPLGLGFAIAIIGHRYGAWDLEGGSPTRLKQRSALAAINALGLVVLFIGTYAIEPFAIEPFANWLNFVAIALVVGSYLCFRKEISVWT